MAILPTTITPNPLKVRKPGDPVSDEELAGTAMSQLADGLNGPSAGVQASISQGNQAVAQYARNAQQQAAGAVAARGGDGQGTANSYAQSERQGVMGQLANNEQNNTKMISDEHQQFLDKAIGVAQQDKTLAQNQSQFVSSQAQQQGQFNASQAQNAEQFKVNTGLSQDQIANNRSQFAATLEQSKAELAARTSQQNIQTLATLGADIPTVASKVMNQVLGQQGTPLTDSEKQDLTNWYSQQKAKGDKLDAQMDTIVQSMISKATTPSAMDTLANNQTTDALSSDAITKKMNSGTTLSADETNKALQLGVIKSEVPTGAKTVNDWLTKNPSGLVNIGGRAYKIIPGTGSTRGTSFSGVLDTNTDTTDYVQVSDMQGNNQFFWDGALHPTAPKSAVSGIQ